MKENLSLETALSLFSLVSSLSPRTSTSLSHFPLAVAFSFSPSPLFRSRRCRRVAFSPISPSSLAIFHRCLRFTSAFGTSRPTCLHLIYRTPHLLGLLRRTDFLVFVGGHLYRRDISRPRPTYRPVSSRRRLHAPKKLQRKEVRAEIEAEEKWWGRFHETIPLCTLEEEIGSSCLSSKLVRLTACVSSQVSLLERLHHRNIVNMVGYCVDKSHKMLIYLFMSNGSLENLLNDGEVGISFLEM
ncbi:unnamed protein product [Microthlaspi erraticum]|uniref:Serine-threonine/tyrosine-protein kinase catalytic domain-containing protein n=1 Tax=Microthlaspi erraticum TaxID=1685480 RepID=A0A6D2KCC3_9BRAS|nr:unnamed protein product [Microthlaspi erraticum]